MAYCPCLIKALLKKCLIRRKWNNFIILNILWTFLLLLSYTTVIQAEPEYHLPYYWPNRNIWWLKSNNEEPKHSALSQKLQLNQKSSYLWPSLNGLIHAVDYTANPAHYTPQQKVASNMILTNLYGILPGSNNDYNMNVIREYPENIQNDILTDNNDDNKNGNNSGNTTPKPKRNGYLHPCFFKICNIAK